MLTLLKTAARYPVFVRPRIHIAGSSFRLLIGAPVYREVAEGYRAKPKPGDPVTAELSITNVGNGPGNFYIEGSIWLMRAQERVGTWPGQSKRIEAGQSATFTFRRTNWADGKKGVWKDGDAFTCAWDIYAKDPQTGADVEVLEVYDRYAIIHQEVAAAVGAPKTRFNWSRYYVG